MKSVRLSTFVACVLVGLILAGCGASPSALPAPTDGSILFSRTPLTDHGYRVLHRFKDPADGEGPGSLTNVGGVLYGATSSGGSGCSPYGCGTIFSITTSGTKKLLYSFKGGSDGEGPGSLTNVNGTLYGATGLGGNEDCYSSGCGTIFKVTISGKEQVLYRFKGGTDAWGSTGPLLLLSGELYGESGRGGNDTCQDGCGTVFKVSLSGKEDVLYRFNGGSDGERPLSGLVPLKGVLFGITSTGGIPCDISTGCGTAFKVTTSGHETVLHRFKGAEFSDPSEDGGIPSGGLAVLNGVVYGTTVYGGNCCAYGATMGTVFSLTASGKEHIVYRFNGGSTDGQWPYAGVTAVNGVLYGSTIDGGSNKCGRVKCGVLFSVNKAGKEQILYDFRGSKHADGNEGSAPLMYLNGVLYGASPYGGVESCGPSGTGCGTVFRIAP